MSGLFWAAYRVQCHGANQNQFVTLLTYLRIDPALLFLIVVVVVAVVGLFGRTDAGGLCGLIGSATVSFSISPAFWASSIVNGKNSCCPFFKRSLSFCKKFNCFTSSLLSQYFAMNVLSGISSGSSYTIPSTSDITSSCHGVIFDDERLFDLVISLVVTPNSCAIDISVSPGLTIYLNLHALSWSPPITTLSKGIYQSSTDLTSR